MRKIWITGGLGFIGSNMVRYWIDKHPKDSVTIIDCRTYAARPDYIGPQTSMPNVDVLKCDIRDKVALRSALKEHTPSAIFHLAAESHVCNSIIGPEVFMQSNIMGTFNLLEEIRKASLNIRFVHVSTDEVFGELSFDEEDLFHPERALKPRSPYAASKAASDFLVQAFFHSYGQDMVITNCSNNYGPNQHLEKLIPKTIQSLVLDQEVTVYGKGSQIRDWLWVEDHCRALDLAFEKGVSGERYTIGGKNEQNNLEIISLVHRLYEKVLNSSRPLKMIHTNDRPTDDLRYAVDITKIGSLGFSPSHQFEERLTQTIEWYLENEFSIKEIKDAA